ncbi:helix-turn-helix domain-containing protein [Anabaena sp. UHCC 0399]|uniref:helix-turn-helix domain-containing protein n=1 Tax=Anabaena sp. UHCC 0399 TaxID=3110238 RepID=UPI003A4C6F56
MNSGDSKRMLRNFLNNVLMLDVLKVRIYPNKEQEISLAKSFGCSRFVWNFYLNMMLVLVCCLISSATS